MRSVGWSGGNAPHLIQIVTRAGHGSGQAISKAIEDMADVFAFLVHFTGLDEVPAFR